MKLLVASTVAVALVVAPLPSVAQNGSEPVQFSDSSVQDRGEARPEKVREGDSQSVKRREAVGMSDAPTEPNTTKADPEQTTDAGSKAASAYLSKTELSASVRDAMLTVLRQHPGESRWSGRANSTMFGITAKRLPAGTMRQRAIPGMLELAHMQAFQELLKAKSLLDQYAATGLTDSTTLERAVVEAAGQLKVKGRASTVLQGSAINGDYAIAYVMADERALLAQLLQDTELDKVRAAYREVMHRQAKDLMHRSNWKDALLLWHHLHKRKLVSQQLYLDAAQCFKALGQNEDVVRVLAEATDAFGQQATAAFLEQAGDVALGIQTEAAQDLARKAYQAASERLKVIITQPENPSEPRQVP